MLELIVSIGILSTLLYIIPTVWTGVKRSEGYVKTGQNANLLTKGISIALSDPASCHETFKNIVAPASITQIKRAPQAGAIAVEYQTAATFAPAEAYLDGKLFIEKMTLERLFAPLDNDGSGLYALTLLYRGPSTISSMVVSPSAAIRRVLLSAKFDAANKITYCQTDMEQMVSLACDLYGGTAVPKSDGTQVCVKPHFVGATTVNGDVVVQGNGIADQPIKVPNIQTSMLTVPNQIIAKTSRLKSLTADNGTASVAVVASTAMAMTKICISSTGNCRTFARSTCPLPGQYAKGIKADGTLDCVTIPSKPIPPPGPTGGNGGGTGGGAGGGSGGDSSGGSSGGGK